MIHKIIHDNYNYKIKDTEVNEVIIPGTEINMEDAKRILSNESERKKYIDAGKNYAKIYVNYK